MTFVNWEWVTHLLQWLIGLWGWVAHLLVLVDWIIGHTSERVNSAVVALTGCFYGQAGPLADLLFCGVKIPPL